MKLLILFVAIAVCTGSPAIIYAGREISPPPPAIESTNPARNTKKHTTRYTNITFSPTVPVLTFFWYVLFLLHRNQCRPKNFHIFFVHNFSEKIHIFPESQLSIRREKFKICIINIYKQTGLFKTISQIKRFSSLTFFCILCFFILCFNLKNIFIIFKSLYGNMMLNSTNYNYFNVYYPFFIIMLYGLFWANILFLISSKLRVISVKIES